MTYCALARTWRPKTFSDFIGQEHAVSALQRALSENKLHHAYLFTGTRGVGKTSIARLFAKSLSCEEGIRAEPCGKCKHCEAIKQGRFLDLIEIDAASRTKVEDTRDLLSQVTYPPTTGRFKIYLIDEVHMLSTHSFNALLKTLEEPPMHVKFLLATTDPQKLPITIQSRCLQFHLQHLQPDVICKQLQKILKAQSIVFDESALDLLAQQAQGSMRDAISLLEQAISSSPDTLDLNSVSAMLGTLPTDRIYPLLTAIASQDKNMVSSQLKLLEGQSYDYMAIIDQCIQIMCQITQAQLLDDKLDIEKSHFDNALIELSQKLTPEQTQTYLTLLLDAKKNLNYYPDHNMAFSTLTMRLMCFSFHTTSLTDLIKQHAPNLTTQPLSSSNRPALPTSGHQAPQQSPSAILQSQPKASTSQAPRSNSSTHLTHAKSSPAPQSLASTPIKKVISWEDLMANLPLTGFHKQVFSQCILKNRFEENTWVIEVPPQYQVMLQDAAKKTIQQALSSAVGRDIQIQFEKMTQNQKPAPTPPGMPHHPTSGQKTETAEPINTDDPKLQSLLSTLDAQITK